MSDSERLRSISSVSFDEATYGWRMILGRRPLGFVRTSGNLFSPQMRKHPGSLDPCFVHVPCNVISDTELTVIFPSYSASTTTSLFVLLHPVGKSCWIRHCQHPSLKCRQIPKNVTQDPCIYWVSVIIAEAPANNHSFVGAGSVCHAQSPW